ncbi:hypothetical protein BCR42DRAFT_396356 [Absidia repens]|uniref:Phenylalanyl tRNA synthetase beta chain core domain-containing protein n=1 Tax=Absidia repens TaxID=90262 RepID=A0A1X2I4V4_9FUNG|nr:hypothetical protein BCR42DRAFT_396356 [Absidia repens]
MPTVNADKQRLFEILGKNYSNDLVLLTTFLFFTASDEFNELCFRFGIELEEDSSEDNSDSVPEQPLLKIDIPANSEKASGFEMIHGLFERMMTMLQTSKATKDSKELCYGIQEAEHGTYFPGRAADIYLCYNDPITNERKVENIGSFGDLHPTVMANFELSYPTTALKFNLEPFV